MRASIAVTALLSALAAKAANITVMVGANNGLTFEPPSITAQVGDMINFQFMAKNHSVTQSTFVDPCQIQQNPPGADSGFMNVPPGSTSVPVWTISVQNATAPLWFFCAQTGHCQKGMVFAINPTAEKTFAMFQANAMGTNSSAPASGTPPAGGSSAPGSNSAAVSGTGSTPASSTAASAPSSSQTGAAFRVSSSAAGALTVMALLVGITL
ncbi:Cupredoxin [Panaeolus papilionaceus]|nr:Cupredoxin [Panaeolus papilionaceus]